MAIAHASSLFRATDTDLLGFECSAGTQQWLLLGVCCLAPRPRMLPTMSATAPGDQMAAYLATACASLGADSPSPSGVPAFASYASLRLLFEPGSPPVLHAQTR
eukprot:scaffold2200_cov413-Prasinococcus_capsulatus_cf.AAC.24